jgi:pyruvate,water dikinase
MANDLVDLSEIDGTMTDLVGGKAAGLGELLRIDGVRVPPGFCVTTAALDRILAADAVPPDLAAAIERAVEAVPGAAWTVRSSATAEDQPAASFAGQHDSSLGVRGASSVIDHMRRCGASLATDRAVAYRRQHGIDDRAVHMAVVVQQMVEAVASGVAFTADPLSGDRRVVAIEAVAGLGDQLVSGQVDPEAVTVRDGSVADRVDPLAATGRVLSDAQALELAALARRIEAHLGCPQDIEWCLDGDGFAIVQSRPITTLFPIPTDAADGQPHVYVSVGHQQMMTDPFTPFGLSMHQMIAGPPMHEAGGRLFVDVALALASPATRPGILDALGTSDPLIGSALQEIVDRDGFLPPPPEVAPLGAPAVRDVPLLEADPAAVRALIDETRASVAQLEHDIDNKVGVDLLAFIAADIAELKRILTHPDSRPVLFAGFGAALWLDEHLEAWLGERGVVDVLSRSAPGNVTAEMGLALLEVADAVRPHPAVVSLLRTVPGDAGPGFLDELADLPGGPGARAAIDGFLATYGMRCVGEIDITRPRWSEQPGALVPAILADVDGFEPGEAQRRFDQGRLAAEAKAAEMVERVRALPDGEAKAAETQAMIARVRTFAGYREHPKYGYICRFGTYKRALVAEADRLVAAGVLRQRDDAWFLRFDEFQEVVRTGVADLDLIDERRAAHLVDQKRTPPRVMTSDGEVVATSYGREAPEGALVGLPVSAGVVEGRARVLRTMADADLEPGDIVVTTGTDPSWSPLFVSIAGLVTEVGGLMTHGAVVAREYGLPAIVGVEHATQLIRDGQRIRLDAVTGHIELL